MLSFLTFMAAAASSSMLEKPAMPSLPQLSIADCADKAIRDRKMQELENGNAFGKPIGDFANGWTAYLDARMAKLGMNKAERKAFTDAIGETPEFEAIMDRLDVVMDKMGADIEAFGEPNDDESACKMAATAVAYLPQILSITQEMMELIDSRIEAEAKRRGISLD